MRMMITMSIIIITTMITYQRKLHIICDFGKMLQMSFKSKFLWSSLSGPAEQLFWESKMPLWGFFNGEVTQKICVSLMVMGHKRVFTPFFFFLIQVSGFKCHFSSLTMRLKLWLLPNKNYRGSTNSYAFKWICTMRTQAFNKAAIGHTI